VQDVDALEEAWEKEKAELMAQAEAAK